MLARYVLVNQEHHRVNPGIPDVRRCVVHFSIEQVARAAESVAQGSWKAPWGTGEPIVNTWKRHHPDRLVEWVRAQAEEDRVVDMAAAPQFRSWRDVFYFLLSTRTFVTIQCERCAAQFQPSQLRVEWYEEQNGPRDGFGGNRYLCPAGHHLYFRCRWQS